MKRRRPRARGEPLSRPAWPRRPSSSRWVPGLRGRRRGKGGDGAGGAGAARTLGPARVAGGPDVLATGPEEWAGLSQEPRLGEPGPAARQLAIGAAGAT